MSEQMTSDVTQTTPELLARHDLTPAEQDEMILQSLLAGFDHAAHDIRSKELAGMDEEIMQQAFGVFDTASSYYSAESAQLLSVVEGLAQRLELLGCAHDHFTETVMGAQQSHDEYHIHAGHDHDKKQKETTERKKQKTKYKPGQKRTTQQSFFAMIMSYFGRTYQDK